MQPVKQTAGRTQLGELAPKFAELNDDVLFGQVWNRQDKLSLKQRSIITVVSLIAKGITDTSLVYHLQSAKKNGVTKVEMAEIITHIAFYVGWPNAWAAFRYVKDVYVDEEKEDPPTFKPAFGLGEKNVKYEQYFKGTSYLNPLNSKEVNMANVSFKPGCRNNWHIHHKAGQILLATDGIGYYQEFGKPAQRLLPGDVVYIAPEVKHWHGASKNSFFAHIAVSVPVEGASAEWLEGVDDEEYNKLE